MPEISTSETGNARRYKEKSAETVTLHGFPPPGNALPGLPQPFFLQDSFALHLRPENFLKKQKMLRTASAMPAT
jgi:hypothetical protein